MKYIVVGVMCLLVAVQGGFITEEQKEKMIEFNKECLEESGVDQALALKARGGDYTDDPKLKIHLFCFNKKAGFQNEAGDLQIDFIKSKVIDIVKDDSIADSVVQKCAIKKDTPEDTAFETAKCFHKFAPQKDMLA